ncbi:GNAT family N-acetyltransferase [Pedobacter insulae]|uniref:ElaA protein n=1 Tax=Pedobacter insulae TaxID=414048 RepID=A0A1I2XJ19_9SPHI|nr:GNAT family N-acetyltransferase [Pedobacter insulae]SFH13498.1 ElaA protein [Pedobacter insulae]
MNLIWIYKAFDELTTRELYAILQLRNEVFVVEQNCVYEDIDNKDLESFHLMAFEDDRLAAYCRVLPPGISYEETSIGRVITSPSYRGKGIGVTLLERAIEKAVIAFAAKCIKIGAQLYLKKFYEGFGFVQTSEVYLEDGIEHIEMLRIQ